MKNIPMNLKNEETRNLIANYHTHTKRCMHAKGEDREYVESAIKAGYKILGFSDHAPHVFKDNHISGCRMRAYQVEEYVDSILSLKKEYSADINILLGFETEYFPEIFEDLLMRLEPYPIDYMIMGQHWLYREDDRPVTKPTTEEDYIKTYVDIIIEGMQTGYFTYLAHPDAVNYVGDISIYNRHMTRLAKKLKELNIPLELNGLGYREGRHYPNSRFWDIVKEVGNDCVIGIDAHTPNSLLNEECRRGCHEFLKSRAITVLNRVI